jgi:16S rRNA (adenine1518-N6/adenine1519-N6)-dimethyltransferase
VGAGLGSLTVALAATGARVVAIESDRRLAPALEEVAHGSGRGGGPTVGEIDVVVADAMAMDWSSVLGEHRWAMVSNLPYNVATPLLLDMLRSAPGIDRYLVMVQREVGERLAASAGDEYFGAVSLKVAYRARAEVLRPVPATVFWPRPGVESVLVRLTPRTPPVDVDAEHLFRVVEEGFAERRKTMRNALRRLGLGTSAAGDALERAGLDPRERAERIDLEGFARLTNALREAGWSGEDSDG